jgi:hypothetical protein
MDGVKITLVDRGVPDIMDIVRELRQSGLVQGVDFDFAYSPPSVDWMNDSQRSRSTTFTFYTEKYATFFALKYAS